MTTIKLRFNPSTVAGREGTIFYQVYHDRRQRQLFTKYHIFPEEWDNAHSTIVAADRPERKPHLLSIRDHIRLDMERMDKIIRRLNRFGFSYTVDDVIGEFDRYIDEYSLFNYMEGIIVELKKNGKQRTSETYQSALNSFRRFRNQEDIMLDSLTSKVMEAFEAWHERQGLLPNTSSFYIRIIRAVYNRAVEEGMLENRNPFRRVYTGIDKTVKRAVPLHVIKAIKNLDLSSTPSADFARDIFILSFMLRGMSFIDMAYLRKTDLVNGYLCYRRRKTGQRLVIEWTDGMQRILDKYPPNATQYLLPIIVTDNVSDRTIYRNVGYNINYNLKAIGKKVGLTDPLTLYVARHSWASIAKSKGIPLSVISEGMGHDNEATTQIYLASLDTAAVDRANSLILAGL